MKNSMPPFAAKKKRSPKSAAPGKNTKGYSVSKAKSKAEVAANSFSGGDVAPVVPVPNNADAALARLQKPRPNRNRKV